MKIRSVKIEVNLSIIKVKGSNVGVIQMMMINYTSDCMNSETNTG